MRGFRHGKNGWDGGHGDWTCPPQLLFVQYELYGPAFIYVTLVFGALDPFSRLTLGMSSTRLDVCGIVLPFSVGLSRASGPPWTPKDVPCFPPNHRDC